MRIRKLLIISSILFIIIGIVSNNTFAATFNLDAVNNFENTLNYTLKSGVHDLGILGGVQMHERMVSGQYYWGSQFADPMQSSFVYDKTSRHRTIYIL